MKVPSKFTKKKKKKKNANENAKILSSKWQLNSNVSLSAYLTFLL